MIVYKLKYVRMLTIGLLALLLVQLNAWSQAINPIMHADVPDVSMIRVGDTYYMSSTTMHMSPGVPIMKSKDLVNWELVSYAYDTLANIDATNLENGESMYGRGSWASSLRYVDGTYYVSTFSATAGKTFIFSTDNPETGKWKRKSFEPSLHDNTIFFDDDGKVYLIWGGGQLHIVELKEDLSGIKEGTQQVLIENANAPIKDPIMLKAEGSQLFKVDGKYYLFNIVWPRGGMRTVLVHRADHIFGPYEGRVAFQDKGVAQGGLIDTPEGDWFAFLFRDYGAVGRIPYLVPVKWENDWPILGLDGKVPENLDLPAQKGLIPNIVASDDFKRKKKDKDLPLVWQWNHNPEHQFWSVRKRKGHLRLTTNRIDSTILSAKNTLTQRTIGPESSGITSIDIRKMKQGDFAGLVLLQKNYGIVGVKYKKGKKVIVMVHADSGDEIEFGNIPISKKKVYLKAECDFKDRKDTANFFYSFDGKSWKKIGTPLKMQYTLPHFMGYRFGLFNFATEETGGFVDFDFFKITNYLD